MSGVAKRMELRLDVPETSDGWALDDDEERMPESPLQTEICDLLKAILRRWLARRGASGLVGSNIAVRWDRARPRNGVDPDVYLVEPAPPLGSMEKSLKTWLPGHRPPRVVVEVVSDATATVDYDDKPARYALSGARELWVFDPLKLGPPTAGGPYRLQVWQRLPRSGFRRVYAGDGPARSEELDAWLVLTEGGARLRLADDPEGATLWPTEAEAERARADAERARAEAAIAELERLRAALAKRAGT